MHKHMFWLQLSSQSEQVLVTDSSKYIDCIKERDNFTDSGVCLWLYMTAVTADRDKKCMPQTSI